MAAATATVLAHPDPGALDTERPFKDLGIDSLTALELRNTLTRQTGLALPATLIFDHPTPTALAAHLGRPAQRHRRRRRVAGARVAARVDEPVAVVGMACRFPGGVDSAQGLWDLVSGGHDAVGGFPTDRGWNLAELFDPDPDAVGKTYTRSGAFVADAGGFDADFFGISAREAQAIDPQQRLLLEVCWEALETAGIDPGALAGSDTGVFAGALGAALRGRWLRQRGGLRFDRRRHQCGLWAHRLRFGVAGPGHHRGHGVLVVAGGHPSGVSIVAQRGIRFGAGRRGHGDDHPGDRSPSSPGNADSLWMGAVKRSPRPPMAPAGGKAPRWWCSNGLAMPAATIIRVLAVIAGSAVNQDGASNGLTAPNGPAQQRVITQAVANAGLTLDHVDVVEAHGTGTTLGDPIEAGALIATYGANRSPEHPLWLGSVKSNIGHTQAAAGAAGLIKMILALNHDTLPPTLHVDRPSPHIDWSARHGAPAHRGCPLAGERPPPHRGGVLVWDQRHQRASDPATSPAPGGLARFPCGTTFSGRAFSAGSGLRVPAADLAGLGA